MAVHDSTKSVAEICFENDQLRKENHYLRGNLRDQFAMAALQGLIAHHGDGDHHEGDTIQSIEGAAETAYEYADAMLVAREAK